MGHLLASVVAIFVPAVAFILTFLTICVLGKVARDVAARPRGEGCRNVEGGHSI